MNAADSSCRTWINRMASCFLRRASIIPFIPSPGRPKTTLTSQSISLSTRISAAVLAIFVPPKTLHKGKFEACINPRRSEYKYFVSCNTSATADLKRPENRKEYHHHKKQDHGHRQPNLYKITKFVTAGAH